MKVLWRFRLPAICAVLGLLLAVCGPAAASQPAGPPAGHPQPGNSWCWCDDPSAPKATLSFVLKHYKVAFGANKATAYGQAHVTGWAEGGKAGHFMPTYTITDASPARPPLTMQAMQAQRRGCPWWINFCFGGHPVWDQAKTWNWPSLFAWEGSVANGMYNDFISPCMQGTVKGDIGYIGGRFLVKMAVWGRLAGFAALKASPQGFAVAVVGGCLLNVLEH